MPAVARVDVCVFSPRQLGHDELLLQNVRETKTLPPLTICRSAWRGCPISIRSCVHYVFCFGPASSQCRRAKCDRRYGSAAGVSFLRLPNGSTSNGRLEWISGASYGRDHGTGNSAASGRYESGFCHGHRPEHVMGAVGGRGG